ncbi:sodium:solute symporter family protein [Ectothiorhodospira lacustris]|uniref:sodium:solute symporter family protein n=1 Tax=Ectothiorhodospira lacustris TaxID=2899127 RepID=UPI001EE83CEC|nr:sodium:solute symporter family protein [Ectothiorhodospira lacustris]MCG5499983.1 cation acetate symporter [Ectothiorhodospira lacustris]MCG5510953.1 cation acetate symporter [Ectothiorhodospira lacustris]MCG5522685.1 cation acetate symporter [Ectothiorhodospira lacustris]
MDLKLMIYLVVGATFALYIGIAIWARAGSTGEFYVAGKGVNPIANGMATAADWMSAASFISMAGLIAFLGYSGSVYLMGWTGGYVLMALLLAPYLRKFGKFTVPQFVGDRFYSNGARIVAVICLLIISITYVIGQMRGVGIAFSRFLEVDILWGLIAGMSIVFVYAVLGGMKGITYTQIAQYVVLIFAYTVPAVFISIQLTGHFLPQTGLGATLSGDDSRYLLQALDGMMVDLGFAEYTTNATFSTLNMFLLTMALMIGTAGLPHVIIRFFTVPRVRDARKSAGWALIFIALLYTTAPAVGAMAMYNLVNTLYPGGVGNTSEAMVYDERPEWMRTWENTGLLVFEDKNDDGRIQYYNQGNPPAFATEDNLQGNELVRLDRDIMVLANPEIASLPNWVIALVAAGGIAAALSTAAGLLLAISSAISHDLLKGVFMPKISEKNELMAGRISMAGAILLAGYLGLNPPGFAAEVVALAFGLAASSLFPVLMMGIFYKRMNKEGAIAGMLTGLISTLVYIFLYKGWFFIPGTNLLADNASGWILGISPQGFGTIGAVLNVTVALIVCKLTAPPPKEIQALVESVRVPRADTA